MEGKTNFLRRLYRLSGTGIAECFEISDVGCNLKQCDILTWLTLTLHIYDRSTLHRVVHYSLFWCPNAVTKYKAWQIFLVCNAASNVEATRQLQAVPTAKASERTTIWR